GSRSRSARQRRLGTWPPSGRRVGGVRGPSAAEGAAGRAAGPSAAARPFARGRPPGGAWGQPAPPPRRSRTPRSARPGLPADALEAPLHDDRLAAQLVGDLLVRVALQLPERDQALPVVQQA